ncbi:MAG: hypothetical protein H5T70_06510, partial [Chloroflexi bacterium]|nr:hypothetical protein [Chloroflexota bacterium]
MMERLSSTETLGRGVTAFIFLLLVAAVLRAGGGPWLIHPPAGAGLVAVAWPTATQLKRIEPSWYYTYGFSGSTVPGYERIYLVPWQYDDEALARALKEHPGQWWMVGNEPNDPSQDNLSPAAYATFYHRFLEAAHRFDPTCHVMPAGIANADWGWAHDFRESYRAQYGRYPRVDAWNIHNFILEPERTPWDLVVFQERILTFREWMAKVGEGDKPLVLSEFGVLQKHLADGSEVPPERVIEFMEASVRWLATTDYVQSWAWFANHTKGQFG